jgi:hypothetical protein
MSRLKLDESKVLELDLVRLDRTCLGCGRKMHVRCRRERQIQTLQGPLRLKLNLVQCRQGFCDQKKLFSPEQEQQYAMPRWGIGWDVFCWIGQRRFSRHWSVSQIRHELSDSYDIQLSDDAIEDHLTSYQHMVAARHQDLQVMRGAYRHSGEVVLTIDGLQPEKGHETLYVVREVTQHRVWFAEPLLSGATDEVRQLFVRAKQLAEKLNLKIVLWISDKQDAFLKCVAEEFPDLPHRYCENHFFRDLAKPVLEIDSTAKKKMRAKIRGLRALEREVLQARQSDQVDSTSPLGETRKTSPLSGEAGSVILDYCSVVRGILNDNHGGPYNPPGVRMRSALADVQQSLERVALTKKVGPGFALLHRLQGFINRGVADQQQAFARVRQYTDQVRQVMDLMSPDNNPSVANRESQFMAKIDEFKSSPGDKIYSHFAKVMASFQVGLFAGPEIGLYPRDNLELERWFRLPKSHERRIHGHHHAGIRIVREGPTLIPTLDAHANHPGVFTREELAPFEMATAPPSQLESQQRHGIMRKSRSQKNDGSC